MDLVSFRFVSFFFNGLGVAFMSRLRYNVAKIVYSRERVDIVLTQRQMHLFLCRCCSERNWLRRTRAGA